MLRAVNRATLQALSFTSVSRCNQRLMFLARAGYLNQHKLACISPAIYTCGKLGVPIGLEACAQDGVDFTYEDIRVQSRRPSLSLLEHALEIGRVYAAFNRSTGERVGITFERFLPERLVRDDWEIRRTDQHPKGSSRYWREVFAPDGAVRLLRAGSSLPLWLFLEVDRGCTNGQFQDKLRSHSRYIEHGMATDTFGRSIFKTAIITANDRRAAGLLKIACDQQTDFTIVTTVQCISQLGPFAPIWRMPRCDARRNLSSLWEWETSE